MTNQYNSGTSCLSSLLSVLVIPRVSRGERKKKVREEVVERAKQWWRGSRDWRGYRYIT